MKLLLFLLILFGVLMNFGCASMSSKDKVRMCSKACSAGLEEYSDDDFVCKCYDRNKK